MCPKNGYLFLFPKLLLCLLGRFFIDRSEASHWECEAIRREVIGMVYIGLSRGRKGLARYRSPVQAEKEGKGSAF